MTDDTHGPHARPAADHDVLGSAETLLIRFTDQLTAQLTGLRPFPEPLPEPAAP